MYVETSLQHGQPSRGFSPRHSVDSYKLYVDCLKRERDEAKAQAQDAREQLRECQARLRINRRGSSASFSMMQSPELGALTPSRSGLSIDALSLNSEQDDADAELELLRKQCKKVTWALKQERRQAKAHYTELVNAAKQSSASGCGCCNVLQKHIDAAISAFDRLLDSWIKNSEPVEERRAEILSLDEQVKERRNDVERLEHKAAWLEGRNEELKEETRVQEKRLRELERDIRKNEQAAVEPSACSESETPAPLLRELEERINEVMGDIEEQLINDSDNTSPASNGTPPTPFARASSFGLPAVPAQRRASIALSDSSNLSGSGCGPERQRSISHYKSFVTSLKRERDEAQARVRELSASLKQTHSDYQAKVRALKNVAVLRSNSTSSAAFSSPPVTPNADAPLRIAVDEVSLHAASSASPEESVSVQHLSIQLANTERSLKRAKWTLAQERKQSQMHADEFLQAMHGKGGTACCETLKEQAKQAKANFQRLLGDWIDQRDPVDARRAKIASLDDKVAARENRLETLEHEIEWKEARIHELEQETKECETAHRAAPPPSPSIKSKFSMAASSPCWSRADDDLPCELGPRAHTADILNIDALHIDRLLENS
eukprot:TRINITY_DN10003_c0_g1_i1.p1 TRINITY_DN10003_c0_g1~~TRINITY_DN10003_c0_g1_i1.p1  ORF type:complete len:626 (+),score=126.93 TRINITY_DN10003_c0_g1_i1:53-1879(+)